MYPLLVLYVSWAQPIAHYVASRLRPIPTLNHSPTDQVLFMLGASVLDQRTRYTTEVPQWAQPGALGFPLRRQMLFMARTQLALLRPWHVVPGRTAYTRVQCVHTIFTSATLSCLGSLLFSQGQQCSVLATCALPEPCARSRKCCLLYSRVRHCAPRDIQILPRSSRRSRAAFPRYSQGSSSSPLATSVQSDVTIGSRKSASNYFSLQAWPLRHQSASES